MDILIIANFTYDFSALDNGRFSYLANMLSESNEVEVVTSSFYHPSKKTRVPIEMNTGYKVTFIDEPGYPKNVCLKRFWSHYKWGRNLLKYLKGRKKPDVIYCAVPSLTGPYLAAKYCEKENIRFVIDVQDLWPEEFQMVMNIPVISDIIFFPFKILADGIYKRADAICAVSDTYCQRAARVNNKVKETTTVFLGTELNTFDQYASKSPSLLKAESEIWIAYCGTLGSSYDLTCVIDALGIVNDERLKFIVMGDGPKMDLFKEHAGNKKINSLFLGRLPYDQMCSVLAACDITVNPITHMAAQSIINKHADYASSGLPVVSTQESSEYRRLVDEYQMGFNCNNEDPEDLADKIATLINDEDLRKRLGKNARRCAEEKFDRKHTYRALCQAVSNQ